MFISPFAAGKGETYLNSKDFQTSPESAKCKTPSIRQITPTNLCFKVRLLLKINGLSNPARPSQGRQVN